MLYWLQDATEAKQPHPSTAWAKLNSKTWTFTYWDREAKEEKELNVPKEFIVIWEWMWVAWFVDVGYWSNEIFSSTNEAIQIRDWQTNKIKFEWAWKDIKDKVKAFGLPLWKHIHYVEPGSEEIKTLKIKGKAWVAWSDLLNETPYAPSKYKISIGWFKDEKNGAIKYKVPVFKLGTELTEEDKELQKKVATVLGDWHSKNKISLDQVVEKPSIDDVDSLPF